MKLFFLIIPVILLSVLTLQGYVNGNTNRDVFFNDSLQIHRDTASLQDRLTEGKLLYGKKCQSCHPLYKPKEFTLSEWKENLDEMKEKAELTQNEYELIFVYLKKNSSK